MPPMMRRYVHWCIVLCVASFVAGYSVAWNSFGAIYISVPPACEAIENPVPSYSDTSLNSSKKKSDRRKKEFHDFFYELIDSSFGEHLIFESNVTGETLKENYRRALIRALTSDNVPIETNASVKPKEFAPPTDIHQTKHDELLIHRLPVSVTNMHGVGRVDLNDFTALMDTGVPLSLTKQKKRDVLILYGSENSLPDHANDVIFAGNDVLLRAQEAFKNCQSVSVIHLSSKVEDKCWALVPGQESFHIQKWVRAAGAVHPKVDSSAPLRLVARGYDLGSGFSYPRPPTKQQAKQHRQWLGDYLSNADSMAAELKPILERIAINKQLVFSVVNAGQSTLLLNFACAARSHGLDISRMLVFVLDEESKELAEWLGMAAYYNQKFLGELPSSDPTSFGDTTYTHIIVAKFIGPHLLSMLGYDFLSQDVDVIWYKDPLTFFNDPMLAEPSVDIFFQDDANDGIRFRPWRGNGGFFFVRSNPRTRLAMKDVVLRTDHLFSSHSHQQTLLEVLSEHVSLFGLRIKTFDADDTVFFPDGAHFHTKKVFMKDFIKGKFDKDLYIFHMNWNKNKKEKIDYMRQMGQWFVKETCADQSLNETLAALSNLKSSLGGNATIGHTCCSLEPIFSCHWSDKPSIHPCKDKPARDARASFW